MCVRVVWIKLQGSFELILGCVPIPVVPKYDETEFGMSVGESIVNSNRLLCCRFRFRKKIGRQRVADECRSICVSESNVGERVMRVNINRLQEI